MTLTGESIARIREAYWEATGAPISAPEFAARFDLPIHAERDGVTGAAAIMLRYLSQGLPGFRGGLREWSYQTLVGDGDRVHNVMCRLWWPRFTAEVVSRAHETRATMECVHWIDDPGERRDAVLDTACEMFLLKRGDAE